MKLHQDSSVSIATHCKLDGPGIESQWLEIFCTHPDHPGGPPRAVYNGYWLSFPGLKWPGHGIDKPPPPSATIKDHELYIYSSAGSSWPVLVNYLICMKSW